MGQIGLDQQELFALELGKIAAFDFVYFLASTYINQSTPNLVTITGRLAQLVERRTREHNVSGLYRCGFESPAGQLKLLIVFRMRR